MKTDLEEAQLAEKQMRHKLDQQSEALNNKTEELRVLTERAHETMSSEILELQMQKLDMETVMVKYFPIFIFNKKRTWFHRNKECQCSLGAEVGPCLAGDFRAGASGGKIQRRANTFDQQHPPETTRETHRREGRARERGSVLLQCFGGMSISIFK